MGGPQCHLLILRNGINVPCHYFRNFPVDFKIAVKWQCRPVKFKGQGPHAWHFGNTPFFPQLNFCLFSQIKLWDIMFEII